MLFRSYLLSGRKSNLALKCYFSIRQGHSISLKRMGTLCPGLPSTPIEKERSLLRPSLCSFDDECKSYTRTHATTYMRHHTLRKASLAGLFKNRTTRIASRGWQRKLLEAMCEVLLLLLCLIIVTQFVAIHFDFSLADLRMYTRA